MPEQIKPEVFAPPSENAVNLDVIYKIEGQPSELDVFELAKVVESFGTMVKQGHQIIHPLRR